MLKLFTIALIAIIILFPTISKAQSNELNQVIEISKNKLSGYELMNEISLQTGLSFSYSESLISIPAIINFDRQEAKLNDLLNLLFKEQNVSYSIRNNKVFISPSRKESSVDNKILKITGEILDAKTNNPIAFANIQIEHQALGIISNIEGQFQFSIPIEHQNKNIFISNMGYESYTIQAYETKETKHFAIKLEPKSYTIDEIMVKPKTALEIVSEAIDKIPNNYSTTATYLHAYYRELVKVDSSFIKYADAACKVYYESYNTTYKRKDALKKFYDYSGFSGYESKPFNRAVNIFPHPNDEVKIIETRASDDLQKFHLNTNYKKWTSQFDIGGGPIAITANDVVKHRNDFLNSKNFNKYIYKLISITSYNNQSVYCINFKPKKNKANAVFEGKLFIDTKSLAFVSIEYMVAPSHQAQIEKSYSQFSIISKRGTLENTDIKKLTRTMQQTNHKVKVDYSPYQDKWYLKRITCTDYHKNTGDVFDDIYYESQTELVVNNLETENINYFNKEEIFRSIVSNYLFEYPAKYNSEFWKNYNAIVPVGVYGKALNDLENEKSLDAQFKSKMYRDTTLAKPVAETIPHQTIMHSDTLVDSYYWMKNRNDSLVNDYIRLENEYADNHFRPLRKKQKELYYEMLDRIERNYETTPYKIDNYQYYHKYEEGNNYAIILRKDEKHTQKPDTILDINKLAKNNPYYSIEEVLPSPNHNIIAYCENLSGGFKNQVKFKNTITDSAHTDSLQNVNSMVWANDNKTIFYIRMDHTYRGNKLFKHTLGTSESADELLFEETDNTFYLNIGKSKDKKLIFIYSISSNETEVHFIDADKPSNELQCIQKIIPNHEYSVAHFNDSLYVLSNYKATNFQLLVTALNKPNIKNWEVLIPHQKEVVLKDMEIFKDYLVLQEQENMQSRIKVINRKTNEAHFIKFDEKIHTVNIGYNSILETENLRFIYSSLITPTITYDYNMHSQKKNIVKQQKVIGKYYPEEYKVERHYALAKDGTNIPISLVYKKKWKAITITNGKREKENRKLFLWAYGSYGMGMYPSFSSADISLLNRGYTIAIAHIRGGDELGPDWYNDGKMLKKKNTFTDFINCAEYLTEKGFSKKGEIVAWGGSAGGMLMGVVANERPNLFKAIILDVPFVDVLNTMLDDNRPLTTGEYKEWGNPNNKAVYEYIKSYSPYNNIKKQDYPAMLFIAYRYDDNAPYWEAAKTVAKLRTMNTSKNPMLLKTYSVGGHQGGSRRFDNLQDKSLQYIFLMEQLGN